MELSIITMHSPDAFIVIYCCNVCTSLQEVKPQPPPRVILSALYNLNDKGHSLLQPDNDHFIITGSKFSILSNSCNSSSVEHTRPLFFHGAYLT